MKKSHKIERQRPITQPRIPQLIRLSREAREIIIRAAQKDGRSISSFIAHYAEEMARRIAS